MTFKKRDSKQVTTKTKEITENTVEKPQKKRGAHLAKHQFQTGLPSANPAGRPKGSRNRFGEKFINDFLDDWEKSGAKAIKDVRKYDPSTYLKVAASLLPKEINVKHEDNIIEKLLDKFSESELDQFIIAIGSAGTASVGAQSSREKAPQEIRGKSTRVY